MSDKIGVIIQIIGPVVDFKFSSNELPSLGDAIELPKENGEKV